MKLKKYKGIVIVVFFIAFIFGFNRISRIINSNESREAKLDNIKELVNTYFLDSPGYDSTRILLFIDFHDFSCPPCEESINRLCIALTRVLKKVEYNKVLIVIRKRKGSKEHYSRLIKNWKQSLKIYLPILIVNEKIFEEYGIVKSSLALINKDQHLVFYEDFPISSIKIKNILNLL